MAAAQPTREQAGAQAQHAGLLFGLSAAAFLATIGGLTTTPFLLAMAADLGTDLVAMSVPFAASSVAWAAASLTTGQVSDRVGRKPVLLTGLVLLVASGFGTALAQDYPSLLCWRLVQGLSGGTQTPTIFAAAADLFPAAQRGRALGWVVTGQSLSLVVGTPLAALIGAYSNWRWAVASVGLAALVALLSLARLMPRTTRARRAPHEPRESSLVRLLANRRVLALFGTSAFERVCYASVATFFATYLIVAYDIPRQWLGGALVAVALGNLLGNQLGARLIDRLRRKNRLVAAAMLCNALLALPLLALSPGVLVSVLLGLLYNMANGAARPALLWMVSEISQRSRGAVMGFSVTMSSAGWLIASSLGGWLSAAYGFWALGLLSLLCGLVSVVSALLVGEPTRRTGPAEAKTETTASSTA